MPDASQPTPKPDMPPSGRIPDTTCSGEQDHPGSPGSSTCGQPARGIRRYLVREGETDRGRRGLEEERPGRGFRPVAGRAIPPSGRSVSRSPSANRGERTEPAGSLRGRLGSSPRVLRTRPGLPPPRGAGPWRDASPPRRSFGDPFRPPGRRGAGAEGVSSGAPGSNPATTFRGRVRPSSRSMPASRSRSSMETSETAVPSLPARPVRPMRWT